jgi:hypothetical protein
MDKLTEKLSESIHDEWISWSKNVASKEKLSEQRLKRWEKMWIPYGKLPEDIKEQDRVWARKALKTLNIRKCKV